MFKEHTCFFIFSKDITTFKSDSNGDLDAIQIADNDTTRIMEGNIDMNMWNLMPHYSCMIA